MKRKCVDCIYDDTDDESVHADQSAVKAVILPAPSKTSQMLKENKKKRVQMKTGEVWSSSQSLTRLLEEEKVRNEKKKTANKVVRNNFTCFNIFS